MSNVDNYFNQPDGDGTDNEFVQGGTVTQPTGGVQNISGTVNVMTGGVLDMETGSALNLKSGSTTVVTGALNSPAGVSMKSLYISVDMTDISTAGSVWVSPGRACTYKRMVSVINGAITVGDAVITTEIGGTLVTDGGLTIANVGSAAGVVDVATPTAANVLTATQALEIISDGGSTDTCRATFVVEFELS